MNTFAAVFAEVFPDTVSLLMALTVFLAAGTLAFAAMAFVRVRGAVKRRTARAMDESDRVGNARRSLRHSGRQMAARVIEYTTKHYAVGNAESMKVLRQRLIRAGIFDQRAVAFFFIGRAVLAVVLAAGMFLLGPLYIAVDSSMFWLMIFAAGVVGYFGPSFYLDRRISARKVEHLSGFPDFMDLLVVCADSGMSMEASLERVGRELGDSYPSLTANIHITNLEIRAGRALNDALERFAERLALDEARDFVILINQSIDLGSSITNALRVYSEDMRHARLSRAEEKAYALPAKLSVAMMVCIFPVLFVVILLPVVVRLHMMHYF